MMQWGISPEIFIGKNIQNPPPGAIHTSSGAYFYSKNGEEPVLRDVLKSLYSQRKSAKGKYMDCQREIEKIEKIIKQKSN